MKRVIFGEVANKEVAQLEDINAREALVLGILAVAVLLVGLWPEPLVEPDACFGRSVAGAHSTTQV